MPLFKNVDQSADAPKFKVDSASNKTCIQAFGNTTQSAIVNNVTMGVFGVSAAETVNAYANAVTHAGWVKRTVGQGPVVSVTITAGGNDYTNGVLTFAAGVLNNNAAATQVTDNNGTIISITMTKGGLYTTAPSVTANGPGTGATITAVLGGRAGRVQMETLVAMGSISGDASDDSIFPDA